MANSFVYDDKSFSVGDTISITYKLREGGKERQQIFKGMLIKIRGDKPESKMITIRKISHSGTGVERIIPVNSPYLAMIKLVKKTTYKKAKAYFVKNLSEQDVRRRVYKS